MEINRENIESLVMDYLEGRLTPSECIIVEHFLRSHPDMDMDISPEVTEMVYSHPETLKFPGRDRLKKSFPAAEEMPTVRTFDMFAIAYLENDLGEMQRKALDQMMQDDPVLQNEFRLLSAARLVPEKVVYRYRRDLKKQIPAGNSRMIRWIIPAAVAASMALLVTFLMRPDRQQIISGTRNAVMPNEDPISSISDDISLLPAEPQSATTDVVRIHSTEEYIEIVRENEPREDFETEEILLRNGSRDDAGSVMKSSPVPQRLNTSALAIKRNFISEFQPPADRISPFSSPSQEHHEKGTQGFEISRSGIERAIKDVVQEDLNFWNIANQGIEGVNKITGSDMKLMASRDNNGEVSRFEFSSKRLKISAPLPKLLPGEDN